MMTHQFSTRRCAPIWRCVRVAVGIAITWACTLANVEPARAADAASRTPETIRERCSDGKVKIEREVTIDPDGNYVNHGAWRLWDPSGKLIAEGAYDMGRRDGDWTRWFNRDDAPLLQTAPFDQFEGPFVSRARFVGDQMDGQWTILDSTSRKCSSVTFKHGKRNGPATLWLPDGQVYREATFRHGLPVGELRERTSDGELKSVATYVAGQQLLNKVTYFPDNKNKQVESSCLAATTIEAAPDDYWQLRFADYAARDENLRHGPWKTWYSNGQLQSEGYYQYDRESGSFTWWHAQGQEAVKGAFSDGQPHGNWAWWHANGQKAAEGQFRHGARVGVWHQWADDGRLVARKDSEVAAEGQADGVAQENKGEPRRTPRLSRHQPAESANTQSQATAQPGSS